MESVESVAFAAAVADEAGVLRFTSAAFPNPVVDESAAQTPPLRMDPATNEPTIPPFSAFPSRPSLRRFAPKIGNPFMLNIPTMLERFLFGRVFVRHESSVSGII